MKKIIALSIAALILVISLAGCMQDNAEIKPNGKTVYNHVTLIIDETNLNEYVDAVHYVFAGTVIEYLGNVTDPDFPDSKYIINVTENLKGNLPETIEVRKHGGYTKDGTLVLYATDFTQDSGLPEVGKQYIFMAYEQPDGSYLLAEINGNVEYSNSVRNIFLNCIG